MKNMTVSKRIIITRLVLCLILPAWFTSGCATIVLVQREIEFSALEISE